MNIFATDPSPFVSARQHCDVHVRKMILEVAQMLSTAHIECDGIQVAYKRTHQHHPCSVWVRTSVANYNWALDLLVTLCIEYTYRFGKIHKTAEILPALSKVPTMPDIGLTPFAIAMPEELRSPDVCASYRRYLRVKLQSWRERERPINTGFTLREVPKHLRGVSSRFFPRIDLGFEQCRPRKVPCSE